MGAGEAGGQGMQPSGPPGDQVQAGLAGFWPRTAAFLVDAAILLSILGAGILVLILSPLKESFRGTSDPACFLSVPLALIAGLGLLAAFVYFSMGESSPDQGTVGKKLLRLNVVDLEGAGISLPRAGGRFLVKILSFAALGSGVLMIAVTRWNQGLHDLAADTLVWEFPGMDPRRMMAIGITAAAISLALFLAVIAMAISLVWFGMP